MRRLNKKFVKELLNIINEIFETYYEEAPKNVKFPYGVVPTLTISPLDKGFQCVFDIEIYNNELSEKSTEDICDDLINYLDGKSFRDDEIGFYLGFESQFLTNQSEQDLIYKRISFIARIFY
jgi:hypothetical protein